MMTTCWILWIAPGGEDAKGSAVESLQARKRGRKARLARHSSRDRVDMAPLTGSARGLPQRWSRCLCHRGIERFCIQDEPLCRGVAVTGREDTIVDAIGWHPAKHAPRQATIAK